MANKSTNRQIHVSPGIYFTESELAVATKSLGITKCGLVGETVKGPAFQIMDINTWGQYQTFFGGTNTEKFSGSQYPKYELPYIAKTFLEQSSNLKVCRVLGLSGVNAGAAWVITAWGDEAISKAPAGGFRYTKDKPMVVAVIRSRGEHKKAAFIKAADGENNCEDVYEYDKLLYYAKDVELVKTKSLTLIDGCTQGFSSKDNLLTLNPNNLGTFGLKVTTHTNEEKVYSVSFNPGEKNYIYNVIGGNPEKGDAEIYVEELYDVALKQLIERGELNTLGSPRKLVSFETAHLMPKYKAVNNLLLNDENTLRRRDVGKRFLFSSMFSRNNESNGLLTVHVSKDNGVTWEKEEGKTGHIYTVVAHTTPEGTKKYFYGEYKTMSADGQTVEKEGEVLKTPQIVDEIVEECVYVNSDGLYYVLGNADVTPVTLDMNNYKEQYRYSSTPWIVSEMKGSANNVELTKLFRFHTISDGDNSRTEVKVSIENIDPMQGTFDVIVRDYNDTDDNISVIEQYKSCTLVPGDSNYIALRIGSFDENYESKSKFITVEVNETDKTKVSIPAGFLGYPVRDYSGMVLGKNLGEGVNEIQKPFLQYNTHVYDDIRIKKQYFGMSNLTGIDDDILKYKGVEAYNNLPSGLTQCFHLDSRILEGKPNKKGVVTKYGIEQVVSVDGITGYDWVTVGKENTVGNFAAEPRFGTEEVMANTIYEDKRSRKFTLCFYGGFDGWDYYRKSRSNSDTFKYQKYKGKINNISGEGTNFSIIHSPEDYGFDKAEKCITSDWYAYLHGIRLFSNPKSVDINVFATPGIDYVNNNLLVHEALDMIEEERADSIYVITTPDKPYGSGDNISSMYTAEEVVDNLDDSEINSNWACTYYPWIKYYDASNKQYIYLPPTKDVVKNFAYTDNTAAPWIAATGWTRGLTDGIKSKKNLRLGEQDELYSGRINYVNSFADEGIRIWGDNNLQSTPTKAHTNKISKRRCLIRFRKLISIACIGLLFDPNDSTTAASFRSAVQPVIEDFIKKRAFSDAKLVVDESEESRDRLELNAQIYIKFTPNTEFINIGLIATPSGVSFDDI